MCTSFDELQADLRVGTARSKTAFLFNRVGLAGCDMGACAMLPRIIGQGRAAELLFTGRSMSAEEGERWGFFNRLVPSADLSKGSEEAPRSIGLDGLRGTHPLRPLAPGVELVRTAAAEAKALAESGTAKPEKKAEKKVVASRKSSRGVRLAAR